MKQSYLLDVNFVLDSITTRHPHNQAFSTVLCNLLKDKRAYLSSSSVHHLFFIVKSSYTDVLFAFENLISQFKIAKTPAYIDWLHPLARMDLEDYLLYLSAKALNLKILTSDRLLLKLTNRAISLENYIQQSRLNYPQNMPQQFFDLQAQYYALQAEIEEKIDAVLAKAKFIMGAEVQALENALQNYTKAKHCITCANGTDALQIALMAIDIQPHNEVITTPFTFVATAETILLLKAKPIFVDIEKTSFLIDPEKIEEKITPQTKAIIPVSLYGQIADMDRINVIAQKYSEKYGHKIYVIEDAAQSFGAEYKCKKSCNTSEIAITSFFPTKPLGCYGDGGAVFTNCDEIAQKLRAIRIHGQSKRYCYTRVGVNSRLDTIQAAILQVKLKYLDEEIKIRRHRAHEYYKQYQNADIITPNELPNRKHIYGQYTVRVKNRDQFREKLECKGILTAVHYPIPLHQQPAFVDKNAHCPIAEEISQQVVSLPMCLYA